MVDSGMCRGLGDFLRAPLRFAIGLAPRGVQLDVVIDDFLAARMLRPEVLVVDDDAPGRIELVLGLAVLLLARQDRAEPVVHEAAIRAGLAERLVRVLDRDARVLLRFGVLADVAQQEIRFGGQRVPATVRADARDALVNGRWDAIGELLDGAAGVKETAARLPYLAA